MDTQLDKSNDSIECIVHSSTRQIVSSDSDDIKTPLIISSESVNTQTNSEMAWFNNLQLNAGLQMWIAQRKEGLRPWTVFFKTSNFKSPLALQQLPLRMLANVQHFQTNYLCIKVFLVAYCLLTSPLLLLAAAISLGVCYLLRRQNAQRQLSVMGNPLTINQQYTMVAICSVPLFYLLGAGALVLWLIGASVLTISAHAAFYDIENIISDQAIPVHFTGNIQQV